MKDIKTAESLIKEFQEINMGEKMIMIDSSRIEESLLKKDKKIINEKLKEHNLVFGKITDFDIYEISAFAKMPSLSKKYVVFHDSLLK